MAELSDVLALLFYGSFFIAWLTSELAHGIWLTIAAIVALILAILALVRLIQKRT